MTRAIALFSALAVLSGCLWGCTIDPSPSEESDPVNLPKIGYEAARIASDPWSAM